MIRFTCPHCHRSINERDDRAGFLGKCPGCGNAIQVPKPAIRFKCQHCGRLIVERHEQAGFRGKCPGCGKAIQVPKPAAVRPQQAVQPIPTDRNERKRTLSRILVLSAVAGLLVLSCLLLCLAPRTLVLASVAMIGAGAAYFAARPVRETVLRLLQLDPRLVVRNGIYVGGMMLCGVVLLSFSVRSIRIAQIEEERQSAAKSIPDDVTVEAARTPLDGDVTITVDVTELPDRRVRLHGTTNLPTDTNLMLSVKERAQGGFYGQSKCSVAADGLFDSGAFGPRAGLKDGVYVADVVMPIPHVQPDNVKKIIGENGDNLSGPLVENGSFGVTVSVEKEFTIGGVQAAQAQQQRARDRIQQYREWQDRVTALHARLQAARGSNDPARWGEFARQFRTDIQSHQDQLMQVQPVTARFMIGTPLDDVRRMFHATAFRKPQDYNEASADYMESLKELQQFVTEAESAQ